MLSFRRTSTHAGGSSMSRRKISSASPSPPHDRITGSGYEAANVQKVKKYEISDRPSKSYEEYRISKSPSSKQVPTSMDKYDKEYLDRKQLAKIKIIAPNIPCTGDELGNSMRKRFEKGISTLQEVLQLAEDGKVGVEGGTCFNSQEYETPSTKELRKIQVCMGIS